MNVQVQPHVTTTQRHLPFECVALVLQGGGALGAYQAGVYEALAEAGIQPDWVAGVSVGAINAAIIAGNYAAFRDDFLAHYTPASEQVREEQRQKWRAARLH